MKREQSRHLKKRRFGALTYTLSAFGIILLAGLGFGYYEYNRLQPQNHFRNLVPITPVANRTHAAGQASTTPPPPKRATPGTFNLLLMGTDARIGQKIGHSDSMILIHVNFNTHQYNMLSIPRDMRVPFPPYGYTKLTSVQFMNEAKYGTKTGIIDTVNEISNLTGIPINYYAETDFWGLQDMVNVIGGIHINLPFKVKITHAWYPQDNGLTFSKGEHFLNGRLTTEVVHMRHYIPGSDYGRQRLQEAALIGIAKTMLEPQNIPKIPAILQALPKYLIATNLTRADMMSMMLGIKGNFHPSTQLHYHQVHGTPETVYNGVLQANDNEIILQPGQLKQTAQKYLGN
jgi:LCP family protein required for cell wall assembly